MSSGDGLASNRFGQVAKSQGALRDSKLQYSAKVLNVLKQFTGGLATEVKNPLLSKYGDAYQFLITGDAQRCREDVDSALLSYQKALTLRADMVEAHVGIGKCLRRKGDTLGAINAFKNALSQNQFDKETHLDLAKCLNEAGYLERSVQHYRRAVQIDDGFTEAKFGLALVLELDGEMEEPTRLYEEIIERDPEFLPAYNNLGSVYLRQNRFQDAEETFRELIERAPDFGRGYLGLAITLDKAGQLPEALAAYQKSLSLKNGARNTDFVKDRMIKLNQQLGRCRTTQTNQVLTRIK